MKHNQNARGRIPYSIVLFIIFAFITNTLNLNINRTIYVLFITLILLYYIFDVFSLRKKYSTKEFLITAVLNMILFFILSLFYRRIEINLFSMFFTVSQNITRYFLGKFYGSTIRVVILGDEKVDSRIKKYLKDNLEYNYIGCISNINKEAVGKIEELEKIVVENNITEIIYIKELEEKISEEVVKQKFRGRKIIDSETFIQNIDGKIDIDKISKTEIYNLKNFDNDFSSFKKRIKRMLDILMAIFVFIIGFPFMVITYFLVKLEKPFNFFSNPAFFKQKRIGFGGGLFEIVKFRSMRLHDPKEHSKYASETDERITAVGKIIRKTRIDELPQLINILKGEMSFVGPRPEWDELGREYEENINIYYLRYAVKPGLTGWAQVMYPYGTSVEDAKRKLEYDLYYIKNQNFMMDIVILFKTLRIVLFGRGR